MRTLTNDEMKVVRTRSVDNLQRLYTVVISLAITESLRGLLGQIVAGTPPDYAQWLMFTSLLFTIVPFYHGANRYLDATYVTDERQAQHARLMIDFLILFVEGLAFFVLAMFIRKGPEFFYTGLATLLLLDTGWVYWTTLTAEKGQYAAWARMNLIVSAVMLISLWSTLFGFSVWTYDVAKNGALAVAAVARTLYDYKKTWTFYYPPGIEPVTAAEQVAKPAP